MKMIACVLALALAVTAEVTKDEGVVVLTADNFEEVINGNHTVTIKVPRLWSGIGNRTPGLATMDLSIEIRAA